MQSLMLFFLNDKMHLITKGKVITYIYFIVFTNVVNLIIIMVQINVSSPISKILKSLLFNN